MAAHNVGRTFSLEGWTSTRRPYLDNLKVLLITAVIAMHGVLSYASTVEVWTYTELREVTLAPVTEIVLFVLVSPFGFFLMALLFLVAGLLTPSSLERKGAARFLRDRIVRLGVPFVLYVLVVQPTLTYALEHPLGDAPGPYWAEYMGAEQRLDTGPLWFVGVLLIFSTGYAGWTAWARGTASRQAPVRQITLLQLSAAAVVVAPASFVIRLVYPYGSESGFTDLNFWEWPVCVTAFGLGICGSRRGWLDAVPVRLARQSRGMTLLGAVALMTLLLIASSRGLVDSVMGGWNWAAGTFAVIDAVLAIFGSVWLLSVAQHRLERRCRWGPLLSRSAYGAFMLQTLFLLGFAIALRRLDVPAEVKAVLVALGGVACSYAVAWILISRVPGVSRVL